MKKMIKFSHIFFILFCVAPSVYSQSPNIKKALYDYKKNFPHLKQTEDTYQTNDSALTVLGRWAWGPLLSVEAKDNFAYIGNGPTFQILDISDPSTPGLVGEYLTEGYVYDIEIINNSAYMCTGNGLLILDISNPSEPTELSFVAISGGASGLAIDSSFAYVITKSGTMSIVDISDIHNPVLRGTNYTGGGELPTFVEAKDGYVYIGNYEWPDLTIINATNPDSLLYDYFQIDGFGFSSFLKDTLLFIGVTYFAYDFKIYSISKPGKPELISQVELSSSGAKVVGEIEVTENGKTAYVTGSDGIQSVDISDLSQPVILHQYKRNTQYQASKLALAQSTIVTSYPDIACFIDISDPDSFTFQSSFTTGGNADKIALKDSLAFIASGLAGLWIIDVSNPEKPEPVSNIYTDGNTSDLVVDDTIVYIINSAYFTGDTSRGLWIINVSDIYRPVILSHYIGITNFPHIIIPNSITKSGNLILLTQDISDAGNNILELIDVTNPYEPIRVGMFSGDYDPHNAAVKDSIVYLATSDAGVRIIDISKPSDPIELSNILNSSSGISVVDSFVYTSRSSFYVINVKDPASPFIISSIFTHSGANSVDLFILDNYAYWSDWSLGIIDISNPSNPIQIATFEGKDRGRGVAAKEKKIFFADQSQGVWILKNNLITDVKENKSFIAGYSLYQNYPNPFNPETTIEFEIPEEGMVTLKIYDILGEEVKTLVNEQKPTGKYEIKFDASELATGVYIYRLNVNDFVSVKKMLLVK